MKKSNARKVCWALVAGIAGAIATSAFGGLAAEIAEYGMTDLREPWRTVVVLNLVALTAVSLFGGVIAVATVFIEE